MSKEYFLIGCSKDGVSVRPLTKEQLLSDLNEEGGSTAFLSQEEVERHWYINVEGFPGEFIIKGKVIVPKPVETVTKMEVE